MPLLADIVGSQQKTSSATIPTGARSFSRRRHSFPSCSVLSCSPWEDTIATPRVQGLYIEDAEEGGLNVSADEWQPLKPPFPCNPIPQPQIFTD
jgi:hypothetical protein